MQLTVHIGEKKTRVRFDPQSEYNEIPIHNFDEGPHIPRGVRGYVIRKAVEKLYGRGCRWEGDYDNLYYGQVIRYIGDGAWNCLTGKIWVDIE